MPQPDEQESAARTALVALGGNIGTEAGPPDETLRRAVADIARDLGRITGKSRLYRTPCFPAGAGPDYVNAALALETVLSPADLLAGLHRIEAAHGRARLQRWGNRTLDLDLLALGDLVLPDAATYDHWRDLPPEEQRLRAPDDLILPHPRLHERGFVLVPLADVAPDWHHPVLGATVADLLAALDPAQTAEVVPLGPL